MNFFEEEKFSINLKKIVRKNMILLDWGKKFIN